MDDTTLESLATTVSRSAHALHYHYLNSYDAMAANE